MTKVTRLRIEEREKRQALNELLALETPTDEQRAEMATLTKRLGDLNVEIAALEAVNDAPTETRFATLDPETRERLEVRSRARLGRYVAAALGDRRVNGAELELAQAAGLEESGMIPLELWEPMPGEGEQEQRAVTDAPSTVGVNLAPIQPAIFAPSVLPRLGVDMPMVPSGTYATATINTNTTADAVAKSAAVPATAAGFAVGQTTPHRIGGGLDLTLEDIAAVGQENFEPILRENVSMVLADKLDDQGLNGDGSDNDLTGLFERLTDPSAPGASVEDFPGFAQIQASGIDGLWATMLSHVVMIVNPDTYRLASRVFQPSPDRSAAEYLSRNGGGFFTNSRMPATDSHVAQGIVHKRGRTGMRTAVCPHWGYVAITDIYSGARKGERSFTVSVLVGDVIVVQPGAYQQVAFRVSVP